MAAAEVDGHGVAATLLLVMPGLCALAAKLGAARIGCPCCIANIGGTIIIIACAALTCCSCGCCSMDG